MTQIFLSSQSDQKGFSLIETLVAVSILMLAVVGPLTIASKGLNSAQFARDQIIAFHLAREATELIRNRRDTNMLPEGADPAAWLNGLAACQSPSLCIVDPMTMVFSSCPGGVCPPLRRSANGVYGYNAAWTRTGFTRSITGEELVPGVEVVAHVTVSWRTGALTKSFIINEHFFNWRQ
ncbi:MAG: prepilin-type N-terminal cleavage/methylation domain-containing protein [Candidatus Yonathbacteria bacterium]|nr:prepilin-type N-terminal cleavage/methylation domain-containing protein [Candidatus Yonathbacteria bacterium]